MLEKICLILLLNILFFAKTLNYKYVSDDIPVSQRPKPKEWWKLRLFQLEGRIRTTPQGDHFLTMVLHALVCVFIYTGFGATDISFLAALYFSVNPINNQGSVWISGRGYVLSALGMTMAMTFPMIAPLALLVATYSNAGFFAPLVFALSPFTWFLWFVPLVWLFHMVRFKRNVVDKMKMEMYTEDRAIKPQKIVVAVKTFAFYFIHAVIPVKTTFYHSYMQSMSGCMSAKAYTMRDRFFWFGLVIIGLILYRFIVVPWDMISFGLLWWCVCLAPFCNFMRMQQEIAERYAYLPNIGLMFVLAALTVQYPAVACGFFMMYATKMWFWMDAYADDYYLVEASCIHGPDSWFCWHVRGLKRWENQSIYEAVILWTMARLISPKEFKINVNLATALKTCGRHKEADEFLKIAAANVPLGQEKKVEEIFESFKKWEKNKGENLPIVV